MTAPVVLSTDGLPEKETAPAWQDWMAQLFSGLDTDLYGDTCFDGHLSVAYAGDVMLTKLDAGRHRVIRDSHRLRDSEAAYLKIVAPWSGHAEVEQHGSKACVSNGSWAIYDTSQPYVVANPQHTEHLIMMVPKQSIAERGLRLENLMGRSVGGSAGIARIALQTMRSTYQELDNMAAPLARRAGELLVDMVHLSLQALGGQATAVTQKQALYDRICEHVACHVRDPGLSVDQVAEALNCSRRHLHNAFAGRDQSLGGFIQQSRLELCMRELHSPALAHRTITEIAMGCGFGNSAHFSRAFKAYAGMSPSEFRALGH
ncbi:MULTISPECIES: AraC-like ligand-binding domain-containing protein [Comamonas]|uniref:Transcriptional activator feaR n=1 Tax=Comamonas testosteroni TaxID=285 RepID=A0A8B4S2U0_COMTE|nr:MULTISPECIES: helix-turn-helix domain-containing protein [Comamonas]EHN65201.1 AraC family transcriptional regulator [Comamonas testosteroni ATCC 11996]QQN69913.1 helix-turn-helix domain-containing protein [Comamonas testosteroni]RDI14191.1 AraC family transcriptional regulator [Comamonas sp. AG1104]SUY76172.1 Transcriptional activator feaR [Comamonas testosteroni]